MSCFPPLSAVATPLGNRSCAVFLLSLLTAVFLPALRPAMADPFSDALANANRAAETAEAAIAACDSTAACAAVSDKLKTLDTAIAEATAAFASLDATAVALARDVAAAQAVMNEAAGELGRLRGKLVQIDRQLARMAQAGPLAEAWAAYKNDKTLENFTALYRLAYGRQPSNAVKSDYDLHALIIYRQIILPKAVTGVSMGLVKLGELCKTLVDVLSGEALRDPAQAIKDTLKEYLVDNALAATGLDEVFGASSIGKTLAGIGGVDTAVAELEDRARDMAEESYTKAVAALHGLAPGADLSAEIAKLTAARKEIGALIEARTPKVDAAKTALRMIQEREQAVQRRRQEAAAELQALRQRREGLGRRHAVRLQVAAAQEADADLQTRLSEEHAATPSTPFVNQQLLDDSGITLPHGCSEPEPVFAADEVTARLLALPRERDLSSCLRPDADEGVQRLATFSVTWRCDSKVSSLGTGEYFRIPFPVAGSWATSSQAYGGVLYSSDTTCGSRETWDGGNGWTDYLCGTPFTRTWRATIAGAMDFSHLRLEPPRFLNLLDVGDGTGAAVFRATLPGKGELKASAPLARAVNQGEEKTWCGADVSWPADAAFTDLGEVEVLRFPVRAYGVQEVIYTVDGTSLKPGDRTGLMLVDSSSFTVEATVRMGTGDGRGDKTKSGTVVVVAAKDGRRFSNVVRIPLPAASQLEASGFAWRDTFTIGVQGWDGGPRYPATVDVLYVRPATVLRRDLDAYGRATYRWFVATEDPGVDLSGLTVRWQVTGGRMSGIRCANCGASGATSRFVRVEGGWEARFSPLFFFSDVGRFDDLAKVEDELWGAQVAAAIVDKEGNELASSQARSLDADTVGTVERLLFLPAEVHVFAPTWSEEGASAGQDPDDVINVPQFLMLAAVNGRWLAGRAGALAYSLAGSKGEGVLLHGVPPGCSIGAASDSRLETFRCTENAAAGVYLTVFSLDLATAVRDRLRLGGLEVQDRNELRAVMRVLLNRVETATDYGTSPPTTTIRVSGPTDLAAAKVQWRLTDGGTVQTTFHKDDQGRWTSSLQPPNGVSVARHGIEILQASGTPFGVPDLDEDGQPDPLRPTVLVDPARGTHELVASAGGTAGAARLAMRQVSPPRPPAGVRFASQPTPLRITGIAAGGQVSMRWRAPAAMGSVPESCGLWLYGPDAEGNPTWQRPTDAVPLEDRAGFTFTLTDNGAGDGDAGTGEIEVFVALGCPARTLDIVADGGSLVADGRTHRVIVRLADAVGEGIAGASLQALGLEGIEGLPEIHDLGGGRYAVRFRVAPTSTTSDKTVRIRIADLDRGAEPAVLTLPLQLLGDANGDGELDLADAMRLLGAAAGGPALDPKRLDLTGDDDLGPDDAVVLLRFLAGDLDALGLAAP